MNSKQNLAEKLCKEIHGEHAPDMIRELFVKICPELGDYAVNFVFGEIYSNDVLTIEERELIHIAGLVIESCHPQLKAHILSAHRIGCSPKKIIATILQTLIIAGFPKVVNAMLIAKEVFEENKML
ncbi:MAG: carboxymuconolactone decarboxylase family protein [Silvanigrellaceae bacterium]|nr:carboxymuconolactone decarboxylase family protein [Silvanigrellaceae bacterium]